jgi:hypothetical protein
MLRQTNENKCSRGLYLFHFACAICVLCPTEVIFCSIPYIPNPPLYLLRNTTQIQLPLTLLSLQYILPQVFFILLLLQFIALLLYRNLLSLQLNQPQFPCTLLPLQAILSRANTISSFSASTPSHRWYCGSGRTIA